MGLWDDVKTKYYVDERINSSTKFFSKKLKKDENSGNIVFDENNKEYFTYDEISELFPVFNNSEFRILVFWDDFAQLVGLGLLDFLNTNIFKDDTFTYGTITYLERDNDFIDPFDFVIGALKTYKEEKLEEIETYGVVNDLSEEEIEEIKRNCRNKLNEFDRPLLERIYKDFYFEILNHSPVNGIFNSVLLGLKNFKNATFVFKHRFKEIDSLIDEINEKFNINKKCHIDYLIEDEKKLSDILEYSNPNSIFACNIGRIWECIVKETKLQKIELFTHEVHNGMNDDFILLFGLLGENNLGPNLCRVHFYKDSVSVRMAEKTNSYNKE